MDGDCGGGCRSRVSCEEFVFVLAAGKVRWRRCSCRVLSSGLEVSNVVGGGRQAGVIQG